VSTAASAARARLATQKTADGTEAPQSSAWPFAGADAVETQIAGVYFLINLMLYLDLPGAAADATGADGAGPWVMLELLARGLLSDSTANMTADPLWSLLARLEGRPPRQRIGSRMRRGAPRLLPRAWLQTDGTGASVSYWRTREGRLRLWSGRGYPLADVPGGGHGEVVALRDCLAALGLSEVDLQPAGADHEAPSVVVSGPLLRGVSGAGRRWLAFVMPYVRYRLEAALGIEAGSGSLEKELLLRPGLVYVSPMHIDVVMALESVSLPVRIAGLDRDPGWLPAFGRVVKLYFE
jgi:hypothetical protein